MAQERHARSENNKIVRERNIELLIGLLQRHDPSTADQLVQYSGLSYPTVFGIIKELLKAGVVERLGYASSTGGRQAYLYSICASCSYTLGIHITSNWIDMVITNIKGGIVFQNREPFSGETGVLPAMLETAWTAAMNRIGIPIEKLTAACICVQGGVRAQMETAGMDLAAELNRSLNIPIEIVAESVVQGFLDREIFTCSGLESYLHASFSESISATIYRPRGETFQLADTFAHVTVIPDGALCSCGKRGCLQLYYNGDELLARYRQAQERNGYSISAPEDVSGKDLFRLLLGRILQHDISAREAMETAIDAMAIALANLMIMTGEYRLVISGLFNSNDTRSFELLKQAVLQNLPADCRGELALYMGMALPADCALGACRMMNDKYASLIFITNISQKQRNKQ